MIIKKANIISFGGIKNKEIIFDKGINIIYGENEKGKSTIQSFIRVWLFGISNKRSKDLKLNERVRFTPVSGEKISGELHVINDGVEFIIKRSFGMSKREDISEVIDATTGEVVVEIPENEPGKYFLGVNSSTFLKTLFISQLGVLVNKDKEEDMMERAANLLGSGDENISVKKAMERLEELKKSLTTSRKNGFLDNLKVRYNELADERYEGYKLSEENIEDENKIISLRKQREFIRKEINNLEIYKKYIKKIKLQSEYEEITQYLKKSELLKKEQKSLEESMTTSEGIIDETLINIIKEENTLYFNLVELKNQAECRLKDSTEIYNKKRDEFKEVLYIEELDKHIKEKLIKITLEQEALKDNILRWERVNEEINYIKRIISNKEKEIENYNQIDKIRRDISVVLEEYEGKLKELKFLMETSSEAINNNIDIISLERKFDKFRVLLGISSLGLLLYIVLLGKNMIVIGILAAISIYLGKSVFSIGISIKALESVKRSKVYLNKLNLEIESIEKRLFKYKNIVGAESYEDFIKKLKDYDEFSLFKEREKVRIKEKEAELSIIDIKNIKNVYDKNMAEINDVLEKTKTSSIDKVIEMISRYEFINEKLIEYKVEIDKENDEISRFKNEMKIRRNRIYDKMKLVGLEDIELVDLEEKLLELKMKLDKRKDLRKSLKMIEETYSVLTKDKNIESIREELKDVISEEINYSYKSEEEIDSQIKSRSNELIEVEKDIKDVENLVERRFIGKRNIAIIEEELDDVKNNINRYETKLKAIELAILKLKEAFSEVRGSFGPILNEKVLEYFKKLSNDRYKEVMVSDSYEIKIRDEQSLISADLLSNGANDQLYLSLRLAFISMLYKEDKIPVILDDAFVQYDDNRVEFILQVLSKIEFSQLIIFTCQSREKRILDKKNISNNYIYL